MTDEELQECRGELLSVGALSVRVRAGSNHYTVNVIAPEALPTKSQVISILEPEPEPEPEGYSDIRDAWLSHAPPLHAHRSGYFTSDKARRAVRSALKRHSLESALSAIENYAFIMERPNDYRWTWSYGFTEFFSRPNATPGVDYFCPEANPLRNFKREDDTLSAEDIFNTFVSEEGTND